MIDNLNLILPLLKFTKQGDFYMLYILKRKKDQPEGEKQNHQSVRAIKTYCIENVGHLYQRWEEIKIICELFKARAYIHVQGQNHGSVSLNMIVELASRIRDGATNQKNLFDSVVGQVKVNEKLWIIDIDTKEIDFCEKVRKTIEAIEPVGNKVIEIIPTKNGFHFITTPFNSQKFADVFPEIDVQKKNPTLLYLPNSLN